MLKTQMPVKREFRQDFLNTKGKCLFTIEYDHATISEYYNFLTKTKEDQVLELLEIIQKNIKYSFFDKIKKKINKNYKNKIELGINYDSVIGSIFANRYRTYESIFTKVKSRLKPPPKSKGQKLKGNIEQSGLKVVCKEYNISLDVLIEKFTLEQYFWLLDGIEWDNNLLSDDGIIINNEAIKEVDEIKDRANLTREAFAKFKK